MKYFDCGLYETWRQNRFKAIIRHYGEDYFQGKTLLEVGAGNGAFGQLFADLGADVTCYEGRSQNYWQLKEKYPTRSAKLIDLESELISDSYDIILNVGLIYHLTNFEKHLVNCMACCNEMILETEVIDLNFEGWWCEREDVANQGASVHGVGTRASMSYIEKILKEGNFTWTRPSQTHLAEMNTPPWVYDWQPQNRGLVEGVGLRAMWFCSKSTHS